MINVCNFFTLQVGLEKIAMLKTIATNPHAKVEARANLMRPATDMTVLVVNHSLQAKS